MIGFMLKSTLPVAPFCLRVASIWSKISFAGQPLSLPVTRLGMMPGQRWRPFLFSPAHHSSSFG